MKALAGRARRLLGALCALMLAAGSTACDRADVVSRTSQTVREERPVWIFYDSAATSAAEVSAAIERLGGRVRVVSDWLHAVSAQLPRQRALTIPHIKHVQYVREMYNAVAMHRGPIVYSTPAGRSATALQQLDSASYGRNFSALRSIGVPAAHALNFMGQGIRIAIIDTGFEPGHEAFNGVRVVGRYDFINSDSTVTNEPGDQVGVRDQEVHGTYVWSILGGNRPGQIIGPAFRADFLLYKVEFENNCCLDPKVDEDRWVEAAQRAGTDGARIISSSLAYKLFSDKDSYTPDALNGDIAVSTVAADEAARRNILVVNAIGNVPTALGAAGPRSLYAPADADSIIAVGAVDSLGRVWSQSARGPAAHGGCCKPELVARGVNLFAARSTAPNAYADSVTGTSVATPLVSGIAAMFMQAWPNLTAMAVREALIESGSHASTADNTRGYGLPNIANAIAWPEGIESLIVEQIDNLNNSLSTIMPIFRWDPNPVHSSVRPRYRIDLATDNQFVNVFFTDTTSNATYTVPRPMRPVIAFWWRVTGLVGPVQTPTIQRMSEVKGPFSMPDWVTLQPLPQQVSTTRPTFNWQSLLAPAPFGPLEFDLQVLTASGQIVQTLRNTSPGVTLTTPLTPNLSYRWRVIAHSRVTPPVSDTADSNGAFVVTSSTEPPTTSLYPSFPNPFPRAGETSTRFWFDLVSATDVELTIHDLRGRLVRRLIPAAMSCGPQNFGSGQYGRGEVEVSDPCRLLSWDGRDQSGELAPRGVYIARLRANGKVSTQRILFLPLR